MMGTSNLAGMLTAAVLSSATNANSEWTTLRLYVGPGISARAQLGKNAIECTDSTRCSLDVPIGSTIEVVARGRSQQLRWEGCKRLSASNRCVVDIGREPLLVTVR
jgi:hypothetical protein